MYNGEREEPLGDQFPFVEGWINPSGIFTEEEVNEEGLES
jgi:hypothetical protein